MLLAAKPNNLLHNLFIANYTIIFLYAELYKYNYFY